MSTSHKSDIQTQISTFVARLKRREIKGSQEVGLGTAHLLLRFISASRWKETSTLIESVRELGKRLIAAQPREFACGNVVRRVLALIREAAIDRAEDDTGHPVDIVESALFDLLSRPSKGSAPAVSDLDKTTKDTKAEIIEGIQELIDEIKNLDDTIIGMSIDMIHENETLLTPTPGSRTVLEFLLRASQKRKFSVLVSECYPNEADTAHRFANTLAEAGIETVIIPDSATFAVMSRVGKVIVGTRVVLANGGCISSAGVSLVCECAKEYRTPILAVTGLYKLSPLYPFDISSLIEVGDSGRVIPFDDTKLMDKVVVTNPTYDYIPPEHIDIYITNTGGFSPSFTYRIVLDYYNDKDVNL